MTQELIPGTGMPLLAGIDVGTSGALVKNDEHGNMLYIKTPSDGTETDLEAIRAFLQGCDMVLMEHPPLGGFGGHTRMSENGCHQQYQRLYGFLKGANIPVSTVRPQKWQKFFGFPKKGKTPDKDWKDFLHQQARMKFPTVEKMPKYSADAFLVYRYLTANLKTYLP